VVICGVDSGVSRCCELSVRAGPLEKSRGSAAGEGENGQNQPSLGSERPRTLTNAHVCFLIVVIYSGGRDA